MDYNDIHRAVVLTVRNATGKRAVSLENSKEKMRGCFKLIEDEISTSKSTFGAYSTEITYVLGYFPESVTEYREECLTFLECVQKEFLCNGINIQNEAHLYVNEMASEIETNEPVLIVTFSVNAEFEYERITQSDEIASENMEELKGEYTVC